MEGVRATSSRRRPGVWLMHGAGLAHSELMHYEEALSWFDRSLKVAERLDLMDAIATGLIGRGALLITLGRAREASGRSCAAGTSWQACSSIATPSGPGVSC